MRTNRPVHLSFAALLLGMVLSTPLLALDLQGTSEWGARVILSTPANGMVSKVHVAPGDEVERGKLLLELDPRRYQSRLAAAESRLEAAQQLSVEARRELDRTLELYDRTLLSDHERKLAEIDAAKADAELRQAEADLSAVRLQRDYSRINAPFGGLVAAVHVQPGQTVVNRFEAAPLVTLVDHRQMLAHTLVDERQLSKLAPGDKVQVGIRGAWLDGVIAALGYEPAGQTDNGAGYRLEVRFTPAEGMGLRSGEKLVIRLSGD